MPEMFNSNGIRASPGEQMELVPKLAELYDEKPALGEELTMVVGDLMTYAEEFIEHVTECDNHPDFTDDRAGYNRAAMLLQLAYIVAWEELDRATRDALPVIDELKLMGVDVPVEE